MVSVEEAKKLIRENVTVLSASVLTLSQAAGLVLAEDIVAPADIPAFPQSSMDGYAFAFADYEALTPLLIDGEMAAGAKASRVLLPGKAVRIFTGAPVPPGADTVVMQEKVAVENGHLVILDEALKLGANVRPQGSEIKKGAFALEKGKLLSPGAIGFIAAMGLPVVPVIPNPVITIIVTGNELQNPGSSLAYGQVYESNSVALLAALAQQHHTCVNVKTCADDLLLLANTLATSLDNSDLILLTGGVSVGDYDFVLEAAALCGVMKLFHKINQRPGKPLYFGKKENKVVFGLPGNPSSVLTCFYQYVYPALGLLTGHSNKLPEIQVPLTNDFSKKTALTFFLKGSFDGKKVTVLDAQESYRLSSFAQANCLVKLDEKPREYHAGDIVDVHLLPF